MHFNYATATFYWLILEGSYPTVCECINMLTCYTSFSFFSGMDLTEDVLNALNDESLVEIDLDYLEDILVDSSFDGEEIMQLSNDQKDELICIEDSSVASSTKIHTNIYVKRFREFLNDNSLYTKFEELDTCTLNDYLGFFYSKLRTKNGEFYSPKTLICIRAAIHRHLTSTTINRKIIIMEDREFMRSNNILKAMIKLFMQSKTKENEEYNCISEDDILKIRTYFDRSTTEILQKENLFNIVMFFGLRGRESLKTLQKSFFQLKVDENGMSDNLCNSFSEIL